jgi:hypothetical protein
MEARQPVRTGANNDAFRQLQIGLGGGDVCLWLYADIGRANFDVCFPPKSGHHECDARRPLSARKQMGWMAPAPGI